MIRKQLGIMLICLVMLITSACSSGNGEKESQKTPVAKDGKTVLTLSVAEPSPFFDIVKKKFEDKYPDISLQIQSFRTGEEWGSGEIEKYQKTINTALLSGSGPDIIEVSMLPIDEYAGKQLLLNMNDYIEQGSMLDKSDLQMNVLDGLKLNGGMYAIPVGFYTNAFVADGEFLGQMNVNVDDKNWNWKEFGEISKELRKKAKENGQDLRYAMANLPPDAFLQELIVDNYTAFVDRDAKKAMFDSPLFVETMQEIKQMFDDGIMTSKLAEDSNPLFYSTHFYSADDLINDPYTSFTTPKLLHRPHAVGQSGGLRIIPSFQFAIRATSSMNEEAWKYIAFLLSDEVQSLQEREGFSLLKSVNGKKLNEIQEQVKGGTFKLPNGQAAKAADEYFTRFQELIDTAHYSGMVDSKVIIIVREESDAYFSGQKSAEEAAKLIQNRVTTFLNE